MDGGEKKNIWVIANWKSNKTIAEALDWIAQVGPQIPRHDKLKVVVCPTFSALSEVKKAIVVGNYSIEVGAQDLSSYGVGAYTGEESAELLKPLINLVILGHSERRQNFGETDEMVMKKAKQALISEITALVCIQGEEVLVPKEVQLVAYEPVWAVGTGNPDTPENANNIAKHLKNKNDQNLEVLYGGSITSVNVKSFVLQENINGVLVGKASLNAQEFIKICQTVLE